MFRARKEKMTSLVLIETNGTLKNLKAKEVSIETLYKKCGFRVNDDFKCRHTWKVNKCIVSLWAKQTGKANFENKYDLPPPIDKELYFGTCVLVQTDAKGNFLDLTKENWTKMYEKLFGGFEELGDEDEYSEDELANVDPAKLTADGYLKDGFVIADNSLINNASASASASDSDSASDSASASEAGTDEDEEAVAAAAVVVVAKVKDKSAIKTVAKKKDKSAIKTVAKKKVKKEKPVSEDEDEDEDKDEESTSELEAEVYNFSDEE